MKQCWSYEEDSYIKGNYTPKKAEEIAALLGRTCSAVRARASKLHAAKGYILWTEEEIEILKAIYNQTPHRILKKIFKNKTEDSIRAQARRFGVRKSPDVNPRSTAPNWTESELEYLRENFSKLPDAEIAERLGRRVGAIKSRASILKILTGTRYRGPRWTEWEFECVRQMYPIFPVEELSKLTGRTECAINAKARLLKVYKSKSASYYPDELKDLIATLLTLKKTISSYEKQID